MSYSIIDYFTKVIFSVISWIKSSNNAYFFPNGAQLFLIIPSFLYFILFGNITQSLTSCDLLQLPFVQCSIVEIVQKFYSPQSTVFLHSCCLVLSSVIGSILYYSVGKVYITNSMYKASLLILYFIDILLPSSAWFDWTITIHWQLQKASLWLGCTSLLTNPV